jgi:CheY-like chemotaxis protein
MQKPFPDLVLLDILLSGMDGQAICRHVKSQEELRCIPIILLSAHTNLQQIARDAGAAATRLPISIIRSMMTFSQTSFMLFSSP